MTAAPEPPARASGTIPRRIEFTPSFSLGTILTLIVVLGGAFATWGEVKNRLESQEKTHAESVARLEMSVSARQNFDRGLEERIRMLEDRTARTDERYSMILTLIQDLKAQISSLTDTAQTR